MYWAAEIFISIVKWLNAMGKSREYALLSTFFGGDSKLAVCPMYQLHESRKIECKSFKVYESIP